MNDNEKAAVSPSRPLIGSTAREENAERKLLQKIYDTLSIGTNEYGHLTSARMDTITYRELEDFLYPSENK